VKLVIKTTPTIGEVEIALRAVAERLKDTGTGNGVWTKEIKKALLTLGREHGYTICTSGVKADWGEWLYDMCWLKHKGDRVYDIPVSVPFIMESEWNTNPEEVIVDFQKLLICKAKTKLLIFQDNEDLIPYLKRAIKQWDDPEGTYLLARYKNESGEFQFTVV
jgi:hypothetical protein